MTWLGNPRSSQTKNKLTSKPKIKSYPATRLDVLASQAENLKKTGAKPEAFEIPFQAIRNLLDHNVSFHVASMSADPRIMTPKERNNLMQKLVEIDPHLLLNLEEEVMNGYNTTLAKLKFAGLKVKWPLKQVYAPVKKLLRKAEATLTLPNELQPKTTSFRQLTVSNFS